MTSVIRELLPPDTALGWAAMRELRPGIGEAADFAATVDGVQRAEGYRLLGAFEEGSTDARAVAGFRVLSALAWGRVLYVDDLATLPAARGCGHAGALLDRLSAEAQALGCIELHLDSGVGADRQDAHRLYMRHGMRISAHHFSRVVAIVGR